MIHPRHAVLVLAALSVALAGTLPARADDDAASAYLHAPSPARGSWLGVSVEEMSSAQAEDLGLPRARGAVIVSVADDSPATRAGLQAGDVILSFDGESARSTSHLVRLVRETPPARTVVLGLLRDGRERSVELELAERRPGPLPRLFGSLRVPDLPAVGPEARAGLRRLTLPFFGGPRYRLGLHGHDLTEQLADHLGVDGGAGVLVDEVLAGTPAEAAGLRAGDAIVSLDGDPVRSLATLRELLARERDDPAATLGVVRSGRTREMTVELEQVHGGSHGASLGIDGDTWRRSREEWRQMSRRWADEWRDRRELWQGESREALREWRERHAEELDRHREALQELREQLRREAPAADVPLGVWAL